MIKQFNTVKFYKKFNLSALLPICLLISIIIICII